jgi:hypothetical protein
MSDEEPTFVMFEITDQQLKRNADGTFEQHFMLSGTSKSEQLLEDCMKNVKRLNGLKINAGATLVDQTLDLLREDLAAEQEKNLKLELEVEKLENEKRKMLIELDHLRYLQSAVQEFHQRLFGSSS